MRITSILSVGAYLIFRNGIRNCNDDKANGGSIVVQWMNSYHPFGHAGLKRRCGFGNVEGRICEIVGQVSFISDLRGSRSCDSGLGSPRVMKIVANQTITADSDGNRFESGCHKGNKMCWVASVPFGLSTATQSTHHLVIWVLAGRMWIQTSQFLWTTSLTLC